MRDVEKLYARFIWRLLKNNEGRRLTTPVEPDRQEGKMSVSYPVTPRSGERLRPGERTKLRIVTRLYPFVETVPSSEEIEYYRSLGDYALAADRQSDGKEIGRLDSTGQWGRFHAIQALAQMYRYYLPEPQERLGRAEGEPMFRYDRRHFFVDGEGRNASGLVGHPSVRPELWRLAKYIEVLGHLGCAPKAVLVGSEERWFRDTGQFRMWFQALKLYGVKLILNGMGEVTEQNCSIICMRVEALSAWLGPRVKRAREAKRGRGEAYNGILTFALDYPRDENDRKIKSRCVPILDQWQSMRDLAFRIAEGAIKSAAEASAWLWAEHDRRGRPAQSRPCSVTFIRKWFSSPIPEGRYPCHGSETAACQVQLEGTMIFDLDVTENGIIRRYVKKKEPIYLPIDIPEDLAIPPLVLAEVRQRLIGRKPRTRKPNPADNRTPLFPSHLVRCAHCGTYIVERPPRQGTPRAYVESRREEDELMVRLRAEGKSYQQIADRLQEHLQTETGRLTPVGKGRVHKRLQLLGINGGGLEANLQKVAEFWSDPFRRRNGDWHLYCHCGSVLALKRNPTEEERRKLDPERHPVKRAGSLTLAAWPALWRAVMGRPPLEEEQEASVDEVTARIEQEDLKRRIEHLQQEIDAVNKAWWEGEFGERGDEEAKRQRDSLKADLEREKAAKTDRGNALAAQIIQQQEEKITAAQFADIQARMAALDAEDLSPTWRQEFIRTFVKAVTVDLETGEWTMETVFEWEELRRLVGKLVPTGDLQPPPPTSAAHAFSWRVSEVPSDTSTRYRSSWYFRVMARGCLVLTGAPMVR